jgi:pimeloyl-ACP methyl ester carboxylesterase
MSRVPIRQGFARSDDGLDLFWRALGEGEPALVCCNGVGVSTFFWEYLAERFAGEHSVVLWDYRGHGRSSAPRPGQALDIPRLARDLGAVIAAVGLERPVLLGHSMGTQVVLERWRQAPHEIGGIVSVLGTYGNPLDTFNDLAASRQIFDLIIALSEAIPGPFDAICKILVSLPAAYDIGRLLKLVDGSRLSRHDLRQYLRHLTDVGFPFFFRMAQQMGEHTAGDLLPGLTAPVLVVAAEFDAFTPPHLARAMHERLPDSEIVWLHGASHAGIVEQPERINEAVADFLARRVALRWSPRGSDRAPVSGKDSGVPEDSEGPVERGEPQGAARAKPKRPRRPLAASSPGKRRNRKPPPAAPPSQD